MKRLLQATLLLMACVAGSSQAALLVLVHGYQSGAGAWVSSGVVSRLAAHGWTPAGLLTPQGLMAPVTDDGLGKLLLAELPSEAPLAVQAGQLLNGLRILRRHHPEEHLVLVGHSAGGVVARMALVLGNGQLGNTVLITIASPHLGTARAAQALEAADLPFPVSWMADVVGGPRYRSLKRSWPLLTELAMAPGSGLRWLNRQSHPAARYVSVVRSTPGSIRGDALVPGYSQDMNNVPALTGRSERVVVSGPHGLLPADGTMLTRILAGL